jgi:hypothetical protein
MHEQKFEAPTAPPPAYGTVNEGYQQSSAPNMPSEAEAQAPEYPHNRVEFEGYRDLGLVKPGKYKKKHLYISRSYVNLNPVFSKTSTFIR